MADTGYIIAEKRNWAFQATEIVVVADFDPAVDTVEITVHQDIDADDASDNEQTFVLEQSGETAHELTAFEAVEGGSDYWVRVDLTTDGGEPSVDTVEISPPPGIIAGTITDADGTPVPGAEIHAVDMVNDEVYTGRVDANGYYEIGVPSGTYHVTAYYQHVDGTEHATDTQPFVEVR